VKSKSPNMLRGFQKFQKQVVMENLYKHVEYLSMKIGDRHLWEEGSLNKATFFRNRNYHQETDTIDTLDFDRMVEVVKGLYYTLLDL